MGHYFLIGPNVEGLIISRWKDGALTQIATVPISASAQTHFEYTWTPTRAYLGHNDLVAFVQTLGLPAVPLEIAADSTAKVEVVEACVPEPPAPGLPPPGELPPGELPGPPGAPPDAEPCPTGHYDILVQNVGDGNQPGAGHYVGDGRVICIQPSNGFWGVSAVYYESDPQTGDILGFDIATHPTQSNVSVTLTVAKQNVDGPGWFVAPRSLTISRSTSRSRPPAR